MRRAAVCLAVLTAVCPAGPAVAVALPSPAEQRAQDLSLLQEVGARADRVLVSTVPGPVVNDEVVLVALSGSGRPERVQLEQRLSLSGTGDYTVRERGPARASEPLGDEPPPVTKFGAVVWQGFSPGARELAARLTLDPVLEAARLPLEVAVSAAGRPLGPGGVVPGAGQVVVRLTNRTAQPAELPTAADAQPQAVAQALDAALDAAPGRRLPAAGAGLPTAVPTSGDALAAGTSGVPLRVTGSLLLRPVADRESAAAPDPGLGTVSGPATTAVPGGAEVAGTLPPGGTAELLVDVTGPALLELSLRAVPALDPRTLRPPGGAASWAAWAATGPDQAARRSALDLLVATAASGARATSYSPYLGADLPGTGTTEFRYAFAAVEVAPAATAPLSPRPVPIALAGLALLLVGGGAVRLWQRS